jgi:GH15 family glucan-1,4-alpha-glucosidase
MALPLEDYGMVGDCQTAALVGRDGSIDWLCLPWFDSGACFAAILGSPENGHWTLAPSGSPTQVRRRYRGDTLILETDYETESGACTVIDCMPPRDKEPDLIRMVVGRRGHVAMRMKLVIRFDYGSIVPWVRHIEGGISAVAGPDTVALHTPVELRGEGLTTISDFWVHAGEEIPFVLMWYPSHRRVPERVDARAAIDYTERWWNEWSAKCTYRGPYREAVMRSLITLKALTFSSTGGIVAAPTTSLPEHIGGVRNWDYRYCWLRDATFTLYSLVVNGYTDEAMSFRDWLLRAVAGDPTSLQIMYGISGERRLTELELPWLNGYENSKPVRIGNLASEQFQLDVYGEVLDMLHVCRRQGLETSEDVWRFELALLRYLVEAWKKPDEGIWEVRGPRRHFTHSKVMAWAAFDRAEKDAVHFGLRGATEKWHALRDQIHDEVCNRGFSKSLNSFVQFYEGEVLDASVLMIPLVGFLPANDPRMVGTVEAIRNRLMRDGFVDRYECHENVDGLPPGEGSFLPCSFWMVDNLALQGRRQEAAEMFERLLSIRNDLGLLSEEYDPLLKRLVGNFPQAFTHVGLVNSALNLSEKVGPAEHRPEV